MKLYYLFAPPPSESLKEFKAAIELLQEECGGTLRAVGHSIYGMRGILYNVPEDKAWAADLLGFVLWV